MTTTESETNTSTSECSTHKSSFELSYTDINDIEETVHSLLNDYISDNILLYSKSNFHGNIENDITEFITNNLTDCGIIHNLTDYYKISRLVAIAIDMYFTNNKCANNIFNFTNLYNTLQNKHKILQGTVITGDSFISNKTKVNEIDTLNNNNLVAEFDSIFSKFNYK